MDVTVRVTAEVRRMIWKHAAEYHEELARRCKRMAALDPMEADVSALSIEIHGAMAAFARAELAKLRPPMQGEKVKP